MALPSMKRNQRITRSILMVIMVVMGLTFILPFYWLISTSLKSDAQLFVFPPVLVPSPLMWENFVLATTKIPFLLYLKNTLIIVVATVIGALLSSSLVAYAFARMEWPGKNIWFAVLLATMMIPFPVTMVPLYLVFKRFGWVNTFLPLTVPAFFGNAFFIFLLRQFFLTIPHSLSDAARIDGCSEFRIYWNIILPLVKPALLTVAIFQFQAAWNDFIGPLIYLNSGEMYTLALGIQQFQGLYNSQWQLLMAASTIMTIPVILLFFVAQRYFIQGIVMTGIKG